MMMFDQDGVAATVTATTLAPVTAFALDAVTYLVISALFLPLGLPLIRRGVMLSSVAIKCDWPGIAIALATAWASWARGPAARSHSEKRLLWPGVFDETTEALVPASEELGPQHDQDCAAVGVESHRGAWLRVHRESSNVPVWSWMLSAIIYGWLIINTGILLIMSHKPLHDRLAGTIVLNHERSTTRDLTRSLGSRPSRQHGGGGGVHRPITRLITVRPCL